MNGENGQNAPIGSQTTNINLYDYIYRRRSTRKYVMASLDETTLAKITDFADGLKTLYPDIKTDYEITSNVKNLLPVKAPHYFLIYSEQADDYLQNIGFMWQQMDLYLSSLGFGSCWLGMAKPSSEVKSRCPFVIALAFGKPEGSPYREQSEFNRKPLPEISYGNDNRLEPVRLAPSATNSQNWFFDCTSGGIDVYQKKLNALQMIVYDKMNKVDIGIALCHLYVATQHGGREFIFDKKNGKDKKGYIYSGTVV